MSIWFKPLVLEEVQKRGLGTMIEHIGIEITELGTNYLRGTMPVDYRTIQPIGLLHGGASIALAETLGSLAANLIIDPQKQYCVGLEINGNHIRSAKAGVITGTATPIHLGSTTQVWNIEMRDDQNRITCISRLTMAVLNRK